MINIKLNSCDIDQAISDYINKELGTKLDFLDYDYEEKSIEIEGCEIYVKMKQGKKTVYKKINSLTNHDPFMYSQVCYEGKHIEHKHLDLNYNFYLRDQENK